MFQVDLKTCLGLVLPNQYCLIVIGENETGFWAMFFHGPHPPLCGPYYTVLLYCMINDTFLDYNLLSTQGTITKLS